MKRLLRRRVLDSGEFRGYAPTPPSRRSRNVSSPQSREGRKPSLRRSEISPVGLRGEIKHFQTDFSERWRDESCWCVDTERIMGTPFERGRRRAEAVGNQKPLSGRKLTPRRNIGKISGADNGERRAAASTASRSTYRGGKNRQAIIGGGGPPLGERTLKRRF